MKFSTTDLCDAHEKNITEGTLRALPPVFSHFGLQKRFFGQVVTLKCFEDNSLVKTELDQPGEGRVLMIDGGASVRCALVGGNIAASAARNGWTGLIVNGAVRDRDELDATNLGIRALGLCPIRSIKRGQGELNVAVSVAGLRVVPGTWLYADADGVLLSDLPLL
jgi:regulator of ribonuclease activity A